MFDSSKTLRNMKMRKNTYIESDTNAPIHISWRPAMIPTSPPRKRATEHNGAKQQVIPARSILELFFSHIS